MDKLRTYLFFPNVFTLGDTVVNVHSPKLNQIARIGESFYNFYLTFATFNFDNVFELAKNFTKLYINDDYSDYENAMNNPWIVHQFCDAISFFIDESVVFNDLNKSFCVDQGVIVDESNYQEFANVVRFLNALEEKKPMKFRNAIARKKHEQLERLRKKYATKENGNGDSLTLKDMCSILCHAEGNGITVFNVGELTIYHLYEHFERLNMKENYLTIHQIYTNGLLDDPSKLKSWMVKTKY